MSVHLAVCRRVHVLLPPCSVCLEGSMSVLYVRLMSLTLVVCRRDSCLIMTFGSSLPLVVCRRAHVSL